MEIRDLVELINLVSSRDIGEFEFENDGCRVRIVRSRQQASLLPALPAQVFPASVSVERVAAAAAGQAPASESPAPAGEAEDGAFTMKAPIVGTFYRSPSPTADSYVKVGDRVKKGQVLCIIEAMKLMNEIESEASGIVAEVLADDGQPVEYGEPLFKIRPEK